MGCCKNRPFTLQRRATISGYVDIILAAIGIITGGIDLEKLTAIREDSTKTNVEHDDAMKSIYMLCVVLGVNILKLIMGYTLLQGAKLRNYNKCRNWLLVSVILWFVQLASFVVKLSIGTFILSSTISTSLALLGRCVAIKVVHTFLQELKSEEEVGHVEV